MLASPPGGRYFYERGNRRVSAIGRDAAIAEVSRILSVEGIDADPEEELATYVCSSLDPMSRAPLCEPVATSAPPGPPPVTPKEAVENSVAMCRGRNVETFDRIESRLAVCLRCPEHERRWCPSCAGHFEKVMVSLSERRPRLPLDRMTGVCRRARAYESAVCSLHYGPDDPVWDGVPGTCWRNAEHV